MFHLLNPWSNIKNYDVLVRFEVSTAVTMMIIIFWEMTPCGSYKNRRFGGSYRLLALLHPEDGGDTILRNVGSYKSHTASSPRR
jgi:hypothetical protein